MSYVAIDQFKAAIGVADTYDDDQIQMALDAAQAMVEAYTNRIFAPQDVSPSARVFDTGGSRWAPGSYGPPGPPFSWFFGAAWYPGVDRLSVPDVGQVIAIDLDLAMDGSFSTSLPSSAWMLYPLKVGQPGVIGNYTQIRLRPMAPYAFWSGLQVRVTGFWGWPTADAPPSPVQEAIMLLANRYLRRPSAPFGIWEGPQMGQLGYLQQTDPDVAAIVNRYRSETEAPDWVMA